jgi:hypothetical protein
MAQPAQTIVDTLAVTSSAAILPATPLALPPPLASQQGSVTEIFPGTATGAAGATAPSMFPTVAPSASDDTPQTTEELMVICRAFIDQLRSGSAPWLLQRLNNTYGSMPTNPSEFSYWMALVCANWRFQSTPTTSSTLPDLTIDSYAARSCRSTSTRKRSCCRSVRPGFGSSLSLTGSRASVRPGGESQVPLLRVSS